MTGLKNMTQERNLKTEEYKVGKESSLAYRFLADR
jgi:hypothetical protein